MTATKPGNRVVLITGGGTGIGRAIALAFAAEGDKVAVAARRTAPLEEVSAACGARPYTCDLQNVDDIDRLVRGVLDDFGQLDVLVNCAGIVRFSPIETATLEEIEDVVRTNLIGTILVTQRCIEPLRRTRGCIINISSTLAQLPQPRNGVYAATKGGIDAFSRVLALELSGDGVRVNVVSPAVIRTDIMRAADMDDDAYEAFLTSRAKDYPLGRIGEPEDVASTVTFLASPGAEWLTGLTIRVDGGRMLGPSLASRVT